MEPYDSVDITEIIKEVKGKFLVYRSPDSAESSPNYELIAEFDVREAAEQFLAADDEEGEHEQRDGPVGFVD